MKQDETQQLSCVGNFDWSTHESVGAVMNACMCVYA